MGAKKRAFYRFVAADSRSPRDGRFIEVLGYYNPIEKPAKVVVHQDKVFKWLRNGAEMSETVESLFRQISILEKWEKIKAGETGEDITIKDTISERKKKTKRAKKAQATEEAETTTGEEEEKTEEEEAKAEES
jgi:small subunit ribosomal protein S16